MIAYIKGHLTFKSPTYVILEANGIGYHINISLNTYDQISSLESCRLFTHLSIKEDAHELYGFYEQDEQELFKQLLGVSGVGPNLSRMILSSVKPEDLKNAIINEDLTLLKSIKGIGAKSGQRIILELKDAMAKAQPEVTQGGVGSSHNKEEALQGLVMLGFKKADAEKAVGNILRQSPEEPDVETLIKQALKHL